MVYWSYGNIEKVKSNCSKRNLTRKRRVSLITSDDINTTITDVASMDGNVAKPGILVVANNVIKTINKHDPCIKLFNTYNDVK